MDTQKCSEGSQKCSEALERRNSMSLSADTLGFAGTLTSLKNQTPGPKMVFARSLALISMVSASRAVPVGQN